MWLVLSGNGVALAPLPRRPNLRYKYSSLHFSEKVMSTTPTFIIDFDSTLVQVEALDELAAIALAGSSRGAATLERIRETTRLGMEGKITIEESLRTRLRLLKANRKHLAKLVALLKRSISPSFKRNLAFLKRNSTAVYVVTAGFREYVVPVCKELGLRADQVYANSFTFDERGNITGFDEHNLLAHDEGKMLQLKAIAPQGTVIVIGDGMTDFQMKKSGLVSEFIAFTENVARESVVAVADRVVRSFDEVLYVHHLPMRISFPKSKLLALLLEGVHPRAIERFRQEGYAIETLTDALDEGALCQRIADVSLLGIRSKTRVTPAVLAAARRLLAIGTFCIGTEQVDLNACSAQGVAVFNAPFSNTRSVVELALGEIIMLMRRVCESSSLLHQGKWRKSAAGCFEVRGKRLGIVGYGNIGAQLSVLAEALGMEVCYYDIVEKLALGNARKCASLRELLMQSDVVTIHVDGRASNRSLIGDREFALMKKGALFLNISRGHIVDISALAKALQSGHLGGAAVDVFPKEPLGNGEEFISELRGIPNIILTPHIGGSTLEAQENIATYVAARLTEYVNTGNSFASVNFPNLQLPPLQRAHRFLHVHRNVPGILAQMNSILADGKINILGQYLKTTEEIGYVITDVNKKYSAQVLKELKSIPETIRFRVLY